MKLRFSDAKKVNVTRKLIKSLNEPVYTIEESSPIYIVGEYTNQALKELLNRILDITEKHDESFLIDYFETLCGENVDALIQPYTNLVLYGDTLEDLGMAYYSHLTKSSTLPPSVVDEYFDYQRFGRDISGEFMKLGDCFFKTSKNPLDY